MRTLWRFLMHLIRGNEKKATEAIHKTPTYWDGVLADKEKQKKFAHSKMEEANAEVTILKGKLKNIKKEAEQFANGSKSAYAKFEKTQNEADKDLAVRAYEEYKKLQSKITRMEGELEGLIEIANKLTLVHKNAENIVDKTRLEVENNKSRIAFNKTVEGLTDGIEEVATMTFEGGEAVAKDYYKNTEKLNTIAISNQLEAMKNDNATEEDFETFINGGKKEDGANQQ